jgi:CubicO group peptidase (beta-lactamase class C family)
MITAVRIIGFTVLIWAFSFRAAAEDFTNAVRAYLQERVEVEKRDVGIVVGIVDEQGSRIVNYGKLDNGSDREVNGDTVFEIGSITKVFTALLLQDMVERGQMRLDDPVSKYLPPSVRMPSHNGKEITLRQLATHMSGLPRDANNAAPERLDNKWSDYTIERLYAFLSGYTLTRDPGTEWEYSNLGFGLLGHVLALKAGTNYESMVEERICRPLGMDSTRITLTSELKTRLAKGHAAFYEPAPSMDFQTLLGNGALRSTVNDMLKFLSANLGLTRSGLTTPMEETHEIQFENQALGWDSTGSVLWKDGGTMGYRAFAGFDQKRRRGVVVLSNTADEELDEVGFLLLSSEWQSDKRPIAIKITPRTYDEYVGQYRMKRDFKLGIQVMRVLLSAHKTAAGVALGAWLCLLLALLRASDSRKRCVRVTCAILLTGLLLGGTAELLSRLIKAPVLEAVAGVRREGDRLFIQMTGWPAGDLPGDELLPESKTQFFERVSGTRMQFVPRNRWSGAAKLVVHTDDQDYSFAKISDQPPKTPEHPQKHIVIRLDPKVYDFYAGRYQFAPAVAKREGWGTAILTIKRDGDALLLQVGNLGACEIYPESETNFFPQIADERLTFVKKDKEEATALILDVDGHHDEGTKLKDAAE